MRNPITRRRLNWRFPLRFWFDSPAEAWEFIGWVAISVIFAGIGLLIINRPG